MKNFLQTYYLNGQVKLKLLKILSFILVCNRFLKCICNENFDIGFFAFSENLVFSDHKNTNLVEKFETEVC